MVNTFYSSRTLSNPASWIELSRSALTHNIDILCAGAGDAQLGCVIKSNAYGNGLHHMVQMLCSDDRVSWLCTFSRDEAESARAAGWVKDLLIMTPYGQFDAHWYHAQRCTPVLYSLESVLACISACRAAQFPKPLPVHIELDTGLHRTGVPLSALSELCDVLVRNARHCEVTGIATHLADVTSGGYAYTHTQFDNFERACAYIKQRVPTAQIVHACASGSLYGYRYGPYNLVRCGTHLYGMWKSPDQYERWPEGTVFKQVLTWKTRAIYSQHIGAGEPIGYGRRFITEHPLTYAILPVGYYDGIPRAAWQQLHVSIAGMKAPVVGMVGMNMIAVDVTHIPRYAQEDVIITGDISGHRFDDWGRVLDVPPNTLSALVHADIERRICD